MPLILLHQIWFSYQILYKFEKQHIIMLFYGVKSFNWPLQRAQEMLIPPGKNKEVLSLPKKGCSTKSRMAPPCKPRAPSNPEPNRKRQPLFNLATQPPTVSSSSVPAAEGLQQSLKKHQNQESFKDFGGQGVKFGCNIGGSTAESGENGRGTGTFWNMGSRAPGLVGHRGKVPSCPTKS